MQCLVEPAVGQRGPPAAAGVPGIEGESVVAQERHVAAAIVTNDQFVEPVSGVRELIIEPRIVVRNLQVVDPGSDVADVLDAYVSRPRRETRPSSRQDDCAVPLGKRLVVRDGLPARVA